MKYFFVGLGAGLFIAVMSVVGMGIIGGALIALIKLVSGT